MPLIIDRFNISQKCIFVLVCLESVHTSGVVKRQSSRVTSHDLALAVRLLLQSTMSRM